jgi:uncharacterized protein (TIGR02246 family)
MIQRAGRVGAAPRQNTNRHNKMRGISMKKPSVRVLCLILAATFVSSCSGRQTDAKKSEAEIHDLLAGWEKAFRAKDLDGVMTMYAPGDAMVGYDVSPPLQYKGKGSYRKSYENFFAGYEGPLELEIRDARLLVNGDLAVYNALERMGGTLKGGQKASVWVRATATFRRIDGKWFDVHDHISVPVDFEKGTAVLDLVP